MDATIRFYKRKFKNALEPMLVMLLNHKDTMSDDSWVTHVQDIQTHVMNNPVEFLGRNLPPATTVKEIVALIFKQFVRERYR
ncbi:MAG TPA: hypothetical protein VFG46_03690 [Chryseolinea sp.]|nr:hypothetical protein [Chryseolinea sp.]